MSSDIKLEEYFKPFREGTVGIDTCFESPYGRKKIIYADWLASGRLYLPIEQKMLDTFGPFVGNTHSEASETGIRMTQSYHFAHKYLKESVNANKDDLIITAGSGMTTVINKLQRILSLKSLNRLELAKHVKEEERPVVFITHMEHHSNQTSWYETIADVEIIKPDKNLLVDLDDLREKLELYKHRPFKIGAFTACSNVTGIRTPYHEMAKIMHENGGICFVDFAASAPYVKIDMHPPDPLEHLDAIYYSPHKFLGGPGTPGVLIFNASLYNSAVPDNPGGGTVDWTNPWGSYKYVDDIETREDGGTPPFLQTIKAALATQLKEQMGVSNILMREEELVNLAFSELKKLTPVKILADNTSDRLGVISFYHEDIHFNLIVRLLNDRFGIQVRGGCACAGTYGHYLLEVSYEKSKEITDLINQGDLSKKPGWVRWSLHPTTTDDEVHHFIFALQEILIHIDEWKQDYIYNPRTNEFHHKLDDPNDRRWVNEWFKM
jgi:selenocysteine lyase/cysteine desulfurase